MDILLLLCSTSTLLLVLFLPSLLLKLGGTGSRKRRQKVPPGCSGLPLVGETLSFVYSAYSPRPESFVDRRRSLYGKVFRSHLFGSPTIVSADAEVSRFVLQSDAGTFVPSYPRSLTELMGDSSILLLNGSLHRRVHGLIGAFFKSSHLKSQVAADMERYVSASMTAWQDDHLVLLQEQARQITFQVLAKVLISLEPGEELTYLKQQFKTFIAGLMSLPVKLPGTRLYRSLQAKKRMGKLVKDIIRRKRENRSNDGCADVVDVLISDGSDHLTDELIADNVIDLMIPGEDSVPILITLAVKYLTECPAALHQIEEENLQLRERKGEEIRWVDYMELQFTQDVISETLRLGNIISGIMRKAMRDVEIKGYVIPKGWCVLTYFRSIHLDGGIYGEPCEFNPWRWQQNKEAASAGHFTPFGGGQRLCPGLDLARLEASIFLHHLVTGFTWAAEEDVVVHFPTVRMRRGLPLRVRRKATP